MAEVIWSVRAYEHIRQIGEYIERDSAFQARRVVQLIVRETGRLRDNVRIGHMIPEVRQDAYRDSRFSATEFSTKSLLKTKRPLSASCMRAERLTINGLTDGCLILPD
ncbi:MAG: hypothetical protein GF331_03355 [Chitinivibrionales bacterium]|nr:hypothetical protein [Chitinivibrionales bacterium]